MDLAEQRAQLSAQLSASWRDNAQAWTDLVRDPETLARRSIAYEAVVDAILALGPASALDLGCGEGWLCRALAAHGVACAGYDGEPGMIAQARAEGDGVFAQARFEDLIADPARIPPADVVVCNFSLLDETAPALLQAVAKAARPTARLIIQAAHPSIAGPAARSGWRMEEFAAHPGRTWRPMPWYFRTQADWRAALSPGWVIERIEEPTEEGGKRPASLLIVAVRG